MIALTNGKKMQFPRKKVTFYFEMLNFTGIKCIKYKFVKKVINSQL